MSRVACRDCETRERTLTRNVTLNFVHRHLWTFVRQSVSQRKRRRSRRRSEICLRLKVLLRATDWRVVSNAREREILWAIVDRQLIPFGNYRRRSRHSSVPDQFRGNFWRCEFVISEQIKCSEIEKQVNWISGMVLAHVSWFVQFWIKRFSPICRGRYGGRGGICANWTVQNNTIRTVLCYRWALH